MLCHVHIELSTLEFIQHLIQPLLTRRFKPSADDAKRADVVILLIGRERYTSINLC